MLKIVVTVLFSSLFRTNIPLSIVFSSFLLYDDHLLLRCYAVQSGRIPLTFRSYYCHHPQDHRLLSKQLGSSKHSSATLPFTCLSSSSSLKTEAVWSPEMSINLFWTARWHFLEDRSLCSHSCKGSQIQLQSSYPYKATGKIIAWIF
jgi:hypothetical protein